MVVVLDTWMDAERVGADTLFRGGMAGGGPRDAVAPGVALLILVIEFCDWTRGGTCGNLPFVCSVDDWRDTMLGARCSMADVTLVMDWVITAWIWFDCGWTGDTFVVGTCGFTLTVWAAGWVLLPLDFGTFAGCTFVAEMWMWRELLWLSERKFRSWENLGPTWLSGWSRLCWWNGWLFLVEHFVCMEFLFLFLASSNVWKYA